MPLQMKSGVIKGAGAVVNIDCGFIPNLVFLNNSRGSAETLTFWDGYSILGFDSGSDEILPGDNMVDATGGGTFTVVSVTLRTGSWAGGDAAGFMEIVADTGTIANNNNLNRVAANPPGPVREAASNVATIDGSVVPFDIDIDTEAGTPASRFVVPHLGVAGTTAKGFTIAAGAAVSGEYVRWTAFGRE